MLILLTILLDRIHGAMMDIYAHAGRVEDVERMMQTIDARDPVKYSILIRAYGKIDRADLAMDAVFVRMMNDPHLKAPTVHVFKQLIEAWIGSSQNDAIEQAYSIFKRMDDNELCQQHNLRPDSFMYGALLKVIGASNHPNSGRVIIDILDDMMKRSEDTNNKDLIPNAIIYNLALNACYQSSKDMDSAEAVLKRMETSNAPPDLRQYNETLNNYALIGSVVAAERAEQILDHIAELSKTNVQLKPNVFTFNTIMNAWIASKDEMATHRLWIIYERMREAHVFPNMATFNALINYLSKPFNEQIDVQRADTLLDLMESGIIVGVSPDRRHYGPLMNGWIAMGDIRKAADVLLRRVMTYINCKGNDKDRCLPTPDHYYLVANGWIRLEELVEATEFLEQIQTLYEKKHLPEGPDLYSYLTLHSAWTRSSHPESQRYLEKLDKAIQKARESRL
jgi:tetratricopeptide (TPR) repeat protein